MGYVKNDKDYGRLSGAAARTKFSSKKEIRK